MVAIILEYIKGVIGVTDDSFDEELLMLANSAVTDIVELGVIDYADITIDNTTTWVNILPTNLDSLVKAYIVTRTKHIFEPTASATVDKTYENYLSKLEALIQILSREEEVL